MADSIGEPTSFAERLRRLRVAAGLTQEALSERSRVSVKAISALETGRRVTPRRDTVIMLADALGLAGDARQAFATAARRRRPRCTPPALPALPVSSTSFVGRVAEMRAVCELLAGARVRVLTLVGPPGVGKTRLALEAGREVDDEFPEGIAWVDLAPLDRPGHVGSAIGRVLGIRDSGRPALDAMAEHIGRRRLLLVLDNFEHLVPAASLLGALLARCPEVQLLVTSRAPLNLRDEQVLRVTPLPLGDAMRLLADRARVRTPGLAWSAENLATLQDVCRRLDCLPLALELAVPWLNVLGPQGLLAWPESLGILVQGHLDLPERQRTMRATLEWSNGLLEPGERALFRKASYFVGGVTLDALAFCAPDLDPREVMGLAAALVHKSLLLPREGGQDGRFGMLETVREYGLEQLTASGEREVAARAHAEYFTALARRAEPELTGPAQASWRCRLEREHDNLRAVLRWAQERGETELGVTLVSCLMGFWEASGHMRECRDWLEQELGHAERMVAPVLARALNTAGGLAWRLCEYAAAATRCEAALELYQDLNDRENEAVALNNLAATAWRQGRHARAIELCERCLRLRRELGDASGVGATLANLAVIVAEIGDSARALRLLEESLQVRRQIKDTVGVALAHANIGELARWLGQFELARSHLAEAVARIRELGDTCRLTAALHSRGDLAVELGELIDAACWYAESLEARERMSDVRGVAACLEGMAAVAIGRGSTIRAARLGGAANALRQSVDAPLAPWPARRHMDTLRRALAALGRHRFEIAWTAGRSLSMEAAAAEALQVAAELRDLRAG